MFSLLYLLSVVEAGWMFGFVFPWVQRVGSVLCCGYHVVSSCFFRELSVGNTWYRWNCRVTSRESSVSSAGVEFVVLWCYGPSILWIRLDGRFRRCRGQSPADWLSGRPCMKTMKGRSKSKRARTGREFSGVQESFKRCSRESFATGTLFSTVQLGPAHGRLVESDCPYGAEPRPCPGFLGLKSKWSNISLIPWKIQTYRFYICLVTHDAKV